MTLQTVSDHHLAIPATSPAPPQTGATSPAAHPSNTSWPIHPDDVTPLQRWRTLPADRLTDAQHLLLRATLAKISPLRSREWLGGLRGDAAAGIALGAREPADHGGNARDRPRDEHAGGPRARRQRGRGMVLSYILRLAPLDHPFGRELSASWLALNLRNAMRSKTMDVARADADRARCASDRHAPERNYTIYPAATHHAGGRA